MIIGLGDRWALATEIAGLFGRLFDGRRHDHIDLGMVRADPAGQREAILARGWTSTSTTSIDAGPSVSSRRASSVSDASNTL
jgi:hypothetical protein